MHTTLLRPAVDSAKQEPDVQYRPLQAMPCRPKTAQRRLAECIDSSPRLAVQSQRKAALFGALVQQKTLPPTKILPHASERNKLQQLRTVIQAKSIIRHGSLVQVPEDYVLQPGEEDESGLRRRRVAGQAHQGQNSPPEEDRLPQPTRTHMETIHGATAHGAISIGSTLVSALTNMTHGADLNALKNAGTDTANSAIRARNELGRGEFGNAAVSSGQAILSGVQTATATPLSHLMGHAAAAMVGSPFPLPIGDALWYPANWAKEGLDAYRTKLKTE
jgi:hypothetical protein